MIEETQETSTTRKRTSAKRKAPRRRSDPRKRKQESEPAEEVRSAADIAAAVPALKDVSIEEIKKLLAAREAEEKAATELSAAPAEDVEQEPVATESAETEPAEDLEPAPKRARRPYRNRHEDHAREDRNEEPGEPEPPAEPVYGEGVIEVSGKGFGFLRDAKRNFSQSPQDIFVTPEVVRKYTLRDGQWIKGEIRRSGRGMQMFRLAEIEGEDPDNFLNLPHFEELTTINPNECPTATRPASWTW